MKRTIVAASLLLPAAASAHIALVDPAPRGTALKQAPCGAGPSSLRGTPDAPIAPGSTITVSWLETVDHPSHYRISFDPDGQHFTVPPDTTSDTAATDPLVLLDLIPDVQGNFPAGGRPYQQQVTLPNIACDTCTLQVIQLMTDKPPYTTDAASNDIYYQCADLVLAGAPATDAGAGGAPDAGSGGGGGGCSVAGDHGGSVAWPVLVALGALLRGRRRRGARS